MMNSIKFITRLSSLFCAVALLPVSAQEASGTGKGGAASARSAQAVHHDVDLDSPIKFDLDFPGGTANELIEAINVARGRPVNIVYSKVNSEERLAPVKVNQVTVTQLFTALSRQSFGPGLATADAPSEDAVWFFQPPNMFDSGNGRFCGFYSLAAYLDSGFTVDDITTAIQTGWKMSGITPLPQMSYHKETKLLIAVGPQKDIRLIDDVLKALSLPKPKPVPASQPALAEPPKSP